MHPSTQLLYNPSYIIHISDPYVFIIYDLRLLCNMSSLQTIGYRQFDYYAIHDLMTIASVSLIATVTWQASLAIGSSDKSPGLSDKYM